MFSKVSRVTQPSSNHRTESLSASDHELFTALSSSVMLEMTKLTFAPRSVWKYN